MLTHALTFIDNTHTDNTEQPTWIMLNNSDKQADLILLSKKKERWRWSLGASIFLILHSGQFLFGAGMPCASYTYAHLRVSLVLSQLFPSWWSHCRSCTLLLSSQPPTRAWHTSRPLTSTDFTVIKDAMWTKSWDCNVLRQTVCQSVPLCINQRVLEPHGGKDQEPHEETFRSNVWPLSLVAPAFLRMALDRYEKIITVRSPPHQLSKLNCCWEKIKTLKAIQNHLSKGLEKIQSQCGKEENIDLKDIL